MSRLILPRRTSMQGGGEGGGVVTPPPPGNVAAFPTGDLPGFTYMGGEDFNTNVALGSAASVYPMVGGYDFSEDTSKNLGRPVGQRGIYRSSRTASVSNSILSMDLHYDTTDAAYYVCAVTPDFEPGWGQLYGKWSNRFRFDPASIVGGQYKVAYLLWPALTSGNVDSRGITIYNAWDYGEMDLPEGTNDTTGYIHFAGGSVAGQTTNSRPHGNAAVYENTGFSLLDWHTYSMEWKPGQVQFLVDEVVKLTHTGSGVPFEKMFWALQAETWLSGTAPATTSSRTAQIDWIAQWAYTP
jgi:hypothetical protein